MNNERTYMYRALVRVAQTDAPVSQGDVTFKAVTSLPSGVRKANPVRGEYIAAHSETGHHHVVDASDVVMYESADPFRAYLVPAEGVSTIGIHHTRTDADHHKSFGLACPPGTIWEVRRQREYDPAGERRAAD